MQSNVLVFVYILQSEASGRYYVGVSENPDLRLQEHNRGQTQSTRTGRPWRKVWLEGHDNRAIALAREREIKGWKSQRRIETLVDSVA